jgi:uncharacterized OB-fold protein
MTGYRPLPVVDDLSEAFWTASNAGSLALARCSQCDAYTHPPDRVCSACGSLDPQFQFMPVSGRGVVRSWSVLRQSFLPGFDELVPFTLLDVELVEQPELRIIGRLLDDGTREPRLGDAVQVQFERLTPEVTVPAFTWAIDA